MEDENDALDLLLSLQSENHGVECPRSSLPEVDGGSGMCSSLTRWRFACNCW